LKEEQTMDNAEQPGKQCRIKVHVLPAPPRPKTRTRRMGNIEKAVEEYRAVAAPHLRTFWVPQVSKSEEGAATASRYFGRPWLADGEAWPTIRGEKAAFVLQLDVAALPEPMSKLLGGSGLVQFFYRATDEGGVMDGADAIVRLVRPAGGGAAEIPADAYESDYANDGERTPGAIVGWEVHEKADGPRHDDADDLGLSDAGDEIAARHDVYLDDLDGVADCAQGDKLGGWPFWTQASERPKDAAGRDMVPFYQIDAGCFYDGPSFPAHAPGLFAGDGTGHLFVSPEDPTQLAFRWACG
jgi:uncharacterized protein YwqG